jgi:hypothetical protein
VYLFSKSRVHFPVRPIFIAFFMIALIVNMPFINSIQMANAASARCKTAFTFGNNQYEYIINDDQSTRATLLITNQTTNQVETQEFHATKITRGVCLKKLNTSKIIKWAAYWTLPDDIECYRLLATSNGKQLYDIVTITNPLLPMNLQEMRKDNAGFDPANRSSATGTIAAFIEKMIGTIKESPGYDAMKDMADTDAIKETSIIPPQALIIAIHQHAINQHDEEQTTTDEEPTTTDEEPTTTDEEPTTTDEEPTTTDEEPKLIKIAIIAMMIAAIIVSMVFWIMYWCSFT